MPASSRPRPEFFVDEHGCWNRSYGAHTSITPVSITTHLDDVFLGGGISSASSPSSFGNFSHFTADYPSSLTSFGQLPSSTMLDDWTPLHSLLSPYKRQPLSDTCTPNRSNLLAHPSASSIMAPYHALSPWYKDVDPIDRKFPDPFAHYLTATSKSRSQDPTHVSSLFSFHTSPSAYIHRHHSLSPLTPMSSIRGSVLHSSPCPSFGSSQGTSSSLTWSPVSSSSLDYLNSPSMAHGPGPSFDRHAATSLLTHRLLTSSKTKLASNRLDLRDATPLPQTERKRKPGSDAGRAHAAKRSRTLSDDKSTSPVLQCHDVSCALDSIAGGAPQRRRFPAELPINPDFQEMYHRLPTCSFVSAGTKG